VEHRKELKTTNYFFWRRHQRKKKTKRFFCFFFSLIFSDFFFSLFTSTSTREQPRNAHTTLQSCDLTSRSDAKQERQRTIEGEAKNKFSSQIGSKQKNKKKKKNHFFLPSLFGQKFALLSRAQMNAREQQPNNNGTRSNNSNKTSVRNSHTWRHLFPFSQRLHHECLVATAVRPSLGTANRCRFAPMCG
jgi:hypothetical protein